MNKNLHDSYINGKDKTWVKDGAYRMLRMLALFNDAYPSKDPATNKYWEYVKYNMLDPNDIVCSKFGACDVCKEDGVIDEYGLGNYICDHPNCNKTMAEYWEDEIGLDK